MGRIRAVGTLAQDEGSIKDRRPDAEDLLLVKANQVSVKGLMPATPEETQWHSNEPKARYV